MNTVNDLRFARTEKLLQDALTQLISSRAYEDIYVSDLVKIAGINRSTFYAHYSNIDHLLGSLIKNGWEIMLPSDERMNRMSSQELLDYLVRAAFAYSKTHQKLVVIALREIQYSPYMADTYNVIVESVVNLTMFSLQGNDIDAESCLLLAKYIVNGVFGCFLSYFEQKTIMPEEEFISMIINLVSASIETLT